MIVSYSLHHGQFPTCPAYQNIISHISYIFLAKVRAELATSETCMLKFYPADL